MSINLSLSDAFLQTFGYQTDAFDPQFADVKGVKAFKRKEHGRGSPYYATDVLGKEYYLPVEVKVATHAIPNTNTTYAEALGVTDSSGAYTGTWMLPYPVISADIMAHYVDTELTERNGMVSELINISGYKINVKGFLINQGANEFPEDDFDTLNRLVNLRIPVRISNPVTDILLSQLGGERMVTLRNLRFPERVGVKRVRAYELDMVSEVPFNLEEIT